MKNRISIKIAMLVLVLAMVFAISGCSKKDGGGSSGGNTEEMAAIMSEVTENISKVESYTFDMNMEIGMSVMGQSMDMTNTSTGEGITNPMAAHMNTTSDAGILGSYDTETYVVEEEGKMVVYTGMDFGDGETMWIKQTEDVNISPSQYNVQASMDMYVKSAESFKEMGTEEVNGKKTTRYDGVIKGDAIKDAIEASGMGDEMGLVGDMDVKEFFDDSSEMMVSIWVDDDKMPVQYEIDMTDVMKTVVDKAMEEVMAEEMGDDESASISMDVDKANITMTFTGFNNVDKIEVPADVVASAEEFDEDSLIELDEETGE